MVSTTYLSSPTKTSCRYIRDTTTMAIPQGGKLLTVSAMLIHTTSKPRTSSIGVVRSATMTTKK